AGRSDRARAVAAPGRVGPRVTDIEHLADAALEHALAGGGREPDNQNAPPGRARRPRPGRGTCGGNGALTTGSAARTAGRTDAGTAGGTAGVDGAVGERDPRRRPGPRGQPAGAAAVLRPVGHRLVG